MADIADERLARLREQAEKRKAMATADGTSTQEATSTPDAPNQPTTTPMYTPRAANMPAGAPTPRDTMTRTQLYLRPDQIEWLDEMAREAGPGVSRSEWVRYAIDELRTNIGQ